MTSKTELRSRLRACAQALSPVERHKYDEAIAGLFLASPEYRRAKSVLLYFGVGDEPDTRRLIDAALRDGKLAALPRITGPGVMEARAVRSLSDLIPGDFNIPEPGEDCRAVPPELFDLILVPGAAFTRDGRRLGRGGGYYDRYLPLTRGVKAAIARPWEVLADIPTLPHDVRIDILIEAPNKAPTEYNI